MIDLETFGINVRGARGLLGWSRQHLHTKAGVGASTIVNVEEGVPIKLTTALAIQKALETNGIMFPKGTRAVVVSKVPYGLQHGDVVAVADASMPGGYRFDFSKEYNERQAAKSQEETHSMAG